MDYHRENHNRRNLPGAGVVWLRPWTITRRGNTLYFQPPGNSSVPLEATAQNKFQIAPGVSFEFDGEKGTMTIKRPQGERVFTKDK